MKSAWTEQDFEGEVPRQNFEADMICKEIIRICEKTGLEKSKPLVSRVAYWLRVIDEHQIPATEAEIARWIKRDLRKLIRDIPARSRRNLLGRRRI